MHMDKAEQVDAQATALFLFKLAQMLINARFAKWFGEDVSRFSWAGRRLHAKLRKDLMFQVRQSVRLDADATDTDQLHALARLCDSKAASIESRYKLGLTGRDKTFTFPSGQSAAQTIINMLSRSPIPMKALADEGESFYLRNAIGSARTYVQSRDTLEVSTNHAAFEQLLDGVNEDYLLRGYPHDLLAHDAHSVRSGDPIAAVLMAEDYCSTYLINLGEPLVASEGRKLVALSAQSKAA